MRTYCDTCYLPTDRCTCDENQMSIFGKQPYGGIPGHEKTDTSLAAAIDTLPKAGTNRRMVYDFIQRQGPAREGYYTDVIWGGATDDEIEQATGLRHQSASPRRRELVMNGLVRDSGLRRKTRSGSTATVWEVV